MFDLGFRMLYYVVELDRAVVWRGYLYILRQ